MKKATNGKQVLLGTAGDDLLIGGNGSDVLEGRGGENSPRVDDTLFGGNGRDMFVFGSANIDGPSNLTIQGISGQNNPDQILDFAHNDVLALRAAELGLEGPVSFAVGSAFTGDFAGKNVVVLTDSFNNGFEAARALADNASVDADEAIYLYFNKNLGALRMVHSQDLGDGGDITVLANLLGQEQADAVKFQANDFAFI